MQIRQLNPAENPRDAAAVVPALEQWRRDYMPDVPAPGKIRLRHWCMNGYQRRTEALGVFADEDATVAEGMAVLDYDLVHNLDLMAANINVPAAGRACGAETALFEAVARRAAELGRRRLTLGMPARTAPAPFVEAYGGKLTDTAIISTLDLSAVDRVQYAAWAEPSAKNSEYTLVGWTGRCPEELAESFLGVMDAMADQPIGTFEYDWPKYTLDKLRFNEEQLEQAGIRRYIQVALAPDGTVAGFNSIGTYPDEPERVEIWDTGVVREHRGHGLGLRIKAAASLWLLEDRPSTRMVSTFNNDENRWMLAVNRALGYRPLTEFPSYEFAIAD
jgi:RimJ/RimL family protein N-acetyltransferase